MLERRSKDSTTSLNCMGVSYSYQWFIIFIPLGQSDFFICFLSVFSCMFRSRIVVSSLIQSKGQTVLLSDTYILPSPDFFFTFTMKYNDRDVNLLVILWMIYDM